MAQNGKWQNWLTTKEGPGHTHQGFFFAVKGDYFVLLREELCKE